jgi:splicing factor 45
VEEKKAHAADLVAQIKARLAAKASGQGIPSGSAASPPGLPAQSVPAPPQLPRSSANDDILPPPPPPPAPSGGADYSAPFQPNVQAAAEEEPQRIGNPREAAGKFAERMLKKYGWEKGQGLGAHNDGITTAIVAKAEKRKKLADAEGGGFAAPKNMGKIVGGKKRKTEPDSWDQTPSGGDDAGHRNISEVIKLSGMLTNLDVDHEIQNNDLLQEIGDEMARNGVVERLFIWREEDGGGNEVFVKFVNQVSALRALQACDGMEFADNLVTARFWDREKFERGEYS